MTKNKLWQAIKGLTLAAGMAVGIFCAGTDRCSGRYPDADCGEEHDRPGYDPGSCTGGICERRNLCRCSAPRVK